MSIDISAYERMMLLGIRHFWTARSQASSKQRTIGRVDQGNRSGVTAGKNLDGICRMVRQVIVDNGVSEDCIFTNGRRELTIPGFYRPTKNWDLLVVKDGKLWAAIEFKSQVGPSFGNNFNNRVEEALGNAADILTAFREGAFGDQTRPFLGYFFVLEDCRASQRPVGAACGHFDPLPEFEETGYAERYGLLCQKLVLENLYDAAALALTPASGASDGAFRILSDTSSPERFVKLLAARMLSFV